MRDQHQPLRVRINSVRQLLDAQQETLFEALPRHVSADQMTRAALSSLRRNPKLLDCTPDSFFGALAEAGALGLVPDGVLGHAYLIPFKDQCTFVAGYKGFINLARRSGDISTLVMEAVYDGDEFSYGLGDEPFIKHSPNDSDPNRTSRPVTYVYVVVGLKDGGKQRKVWSKAQIDAHKERYSRGWQKTDSPWQTAWVTMAKKTVLRDMVNRGEVPVSVELQRLAAREEQYEVEATRREPIPAVPGVSRVDSLFDRLTAPPEPPEPPYNPPTAAEEAAADSQVDPAVDAGEGLDEPQEPPGAVNEDAEPSEAALSEGQFGFYVRRLETWPSLSTLGVIEAEIANDPLLNGKHHGLLQELIQRAMGRLKAKAKVGRPGTKSQG
jgi:recombination protein RecT